MAQKDARHCRLYHPEVSQISYRGAVDIFPLAQQFCFATVLLYDYARGINYRDGEPAAPQHFLNFLPLRHGQ
jgi:hypothetical protein